MVVVVVATDDPVVGRGAGRHALGVVALGDDRLGRLFDLLVVEHRLLTEGGPLGASNGAFLRHLDRVRADGRRLLA